MNVRIISVCLLSVVSVVLICAPPSSADELDSREELVLGVSMYLQFADLGVSMFNGFLWLTGREWAPLGWTGIALGGATIVSSAMCPLWTDDDDDDFALAVAVSGVVIGGVTMALGIIGKRNAQDDRQQQGSRATSVSPSVFRGGDGKLKAGVVVQIGF